MKNQVERHFTATTFVVNDGKVLLIKHTKLRMWLPPGGHIESNELPEDAALREVKEETGLNIELIGKKCDGCKTNSCGYLLPPQHLLLEDIEPGHQHIDMIYFAKANSSELNKKDGWTEAKWFSKDDLDSKEIPEDVRSLAKLALEMVK